MFTFIILLMTLTSASIANDFSLKNSSETSTSKQVQPLVFPEKINVNGEIMTYKSPSEVEGDRVASLYQYDFNRKSIDILERTLYVYAFMLVISIIQAGFFYYQLKLMRKAAREAESASRAAEEATLIAKNAYISSERPWISVVATLS